MSEGGYERWSEIRALLRLAGPMVLSQTAFVLMGLVDTAMSGHAGAREQAVVGLGVALWIPVFIGLMNVGGDPYVIEYNVRLGDPETQAILPRLRSDLMDLFEGIAHNTLSERHVDMDDRTCTTVVMASEGYPGNYRKGFPIVGLDMVTNALVFHAGTTLENGRPVTQGGRVLAVTAMGKDLEQSLATVYKGLAPIDYEGKRFRSDIGHDLARQTARTGSTQQA